MALDKIRIMWSVSLIATGMATFILAGANVIGAQLPDILVRVLGVIDLVALPVLAFSTIKLAKANK
ncbi:MAG: hypothetical protein IJZ95_00485 [Oscillospiraceae bacterium]|nr:hypothetical protein [Oscillospiraceae bacterium]